MSDARQGAGGTALVVAASLRHTDPNIRTECLEALKRAVSDQGANGLSAAVARGLLAARGEPMAPFVISSHEAGLAGLIVALAANSSPEFRGVRVLSAETVGTRGGVVVRLRRGTPRFGNATERDAQLPYFAPLALRWRSGRDTPVLLQGEAWLVTNEYGLEVRIPSQALGSSAGRYLDEFFESGRIEGAAGNFARLGLRVALEDGAIAISTGSPEAMLRFATAAGSSASLDLAAAHSGHTEVRVRVRLRAPADGVIPLRCAAALFHVVPYPWTNLSLGELEMSDALRSALARWFCAPCEWAGQVLAGLTEHD